MSSLPELPGYQTARHASLTAERLDGVVEGEEDNLGSDRPRSKSYQHGIKVGSAGQAPLSPVSRSQADLSASLQMLDFLSADLPTSSSPLRRWSIFILDAIMKGSSTKNLILFIEFIEARYDWLRA